MAPILIVEDNEINAEILTTLLESRGLANEIAIDGVDSIDKCASRPKDYYSLILMDIHMPHMNGYEAAKRLKTELNITAPIIAQTATTTTPESIREHASYITDYLYKPFKPDQLFELIDRHGFQQA